jgi:PTH1 family peptidyl-tRNA hydrolase
LNLIVALGNPGKDYENTRHNVGFLFSDFYMDFQNFNLKKKNNRFFLYESENTFLLKPLTYMNLSGIAVQEVMSYYKINSENILVIYDDFEFKLGEFKLKPKGSGGTHNGMKSIIQHINTLNFARLRIGIGPIPDSVTTIDYVLSKFSKLELKLLQENVFSKLKNLVDIWINSGINIAVSKQNIL